MTEEEDFDAQPLVFLKREIYDCLDMLKELKQSIFLDIGNDNLGKINFCIEVLENYGRRDLKDFEEDD
jgi:hypothetical protein